MSIKHYETEKQASGDFTITKPVSVAEGDLLVAVKLSTANGFTGTFTPPTGFSAATKYDVEFTGLTGSNRREEIYVTYKTATNSEPASYFFNTEFSGAAYLFFLVLDGRDGTVTEIFTDAADYAGTSFTLPLTGYTAAAGDDIFSIGAIAGGSAMTSISTPTGYTQRTDRATEVQTPSKSASLENASAGATGTIDYNVVSPAGTYAGFGIVLAFPEAAGPTYTITSIDGDNDVQAGQTGAIITTSGIDPASVTQAVTLGGETLTINTWS